MNSDELEADRAAAAEPTTAVADPPLLHFMKLLVIGLGVLLVLGFFTVIARMVYVASRPAAQAVSAAPPAAAIQSLSLPSGAVARATSVAGSRLTVHYETSAGAAIAVFDLDTGRIVSRVCIEHDPNCPGNPLVSLRAREKVAACPCALPHI